MNSSSILLIIWNAGDNTERWSLHQKGLQFSCFVIFFVLDIQNNCYRTPFDCKYAQRSTFDPSTACK